MKRRHKMYLKLNLVSLFFIVVSFVSVTLAWFAYSGLANFATEVNVKAWNIELKKNGEKVSHNITISLSEIYPGMEVVSEKINIKNAGDSDAKIVYSIVSARILDASKDNYIVDQTTTISEKVEDSLSHDYPFHINMNLGKNYIVSKGGEIDFEVSFSWPLDSDIDELDSQWGAEAYRFQGEEETKKQQDSHYQVRPSIQIVITLNAEQYLEDNNASDMNYNLGDVILFDILSNKKCIKLSDTCLKTYVIDVNNKLGDDTVTLLPNPYSIYMAGTFNNYNSLLATITADWQANTRALMVEDILRIVSTDVMNSLLIREGISDSIIGNLKYEHRSDYVINKAISYNGHYSFVNERFNYLSSNNCYWTKNEYNSENAFVVQRMDENESRIYGESKAATCNVVPVILADKESL